MPGFDPALARRAAGGARRRRDRGGRGRRLLADPRPAARDPGRGPPDRRPRRRRRDDGGLRVRRRGRARPALRGPVRGGQPRQRRGGDGAHARGDRARTAPPTRPRCGRRSRRSCRAWNNSRHVLRSSLESIVRGYAADYFSASASGRAGCRPLPGVDEAPRRRFVRVRRRRRERRRDQAPRLGRVDHVVELEEGGGVERLRVLVGVRRPSPRTRSLALVVVVDRVELAAEARAGPRPRAPSRRARPSASRPSAAARAGCRRPSPGRRARRPCAGSPRPAAPAGSRRRRRGASSGGRAPSPRRRGRPSSPACRSARAIGRPKASQSCMKRAALSAPSLVIAPASCIGLLATMPIGRPSIRASAVTIPGANSSRR